METKLKAMNCMERFPWFSWHWGHNWGHNWGQITYTVYKATVTFTAIL